jgi:hypothetical protein
MSTKKPKLSTVTADTDPPITPVVKSILRKPSDAQLAQLHQGGAAVTQAQARAGVASINLLVATQEAAQAEQSYSAYLTEVALTLGIEKDQHKDWEWDAANESFVKKA